MSAGDAGDAALVARFLSRGGATRGGVTHGGTAPARPGVLFIDGHSGSGKTTLAARLGRELHLQTGSTPHILGMDELYPGWDGLAAGSASLAGALTERRYRRYDWTAGEFGDEVALDATRTLIVEGCGSITAASLAAASSTAARGWGGAYGVWISCPLELRRARALARDGAMFEPHWERWAAQEREHFAQAQPIARATETMHVA